MKVVRIPAPAASHAALPTWALRLSCLAFAALVACGGGQDSPVSMIEEDQVVSTAAQLNDGRLHPLASPQERAAAARAAAPGFIPTGDPNAQTLGVFGPVVPWPLMPIHQVLMPDGRVLTYGSDITGIQGGGLHYAVWDPTLGTGADAFDVLPTVTGTDLFCAGQALLPDTGDVLIVGGTKTINGQRGYGTEETNRFEGAANTLVSGAPMAYRRWYPTLLTLASGDQLTLGGRIDKDSTIGGLTPLGGAIPEAATSTYASTPEVWSPTAGWRTLSAIPSDDAYGATTQSWYYPRAWVMPSGKVFVMSTTGNLYQVDSTGAGVLTKLKPKVALSNARLQSVMYQPGKIISVRTKASTTLIDINGKQPVVTQTTPTSRYRQFGNATLLADGQVWLNGGSADGNVTTNDYFVSETWNPATGAWTDGASATVARLYHSSALLLPDGSVMTGGGGDPGPFTNLNAEIYYPPYLYLKDGTGTPAPRPTITSAPDVLGWAQPFTVGFSSATPISRVTLVRTGTVTHDFNSNQRFQELAFTQSNGQLSLKTPATSGNAPPGYYMLFIFDGNGVPAIARVVKIAT